MTERDNPYAASQYSGASYTAAAPQPVAPMPNGNPTGAQAASAAATTPGDLVSDTTTANFMRDVIQESRNQPVLVDFWAPWCGPCKQLTPVIEQVVRAAGGRVKLVKLNIDDHPAIPGQMGIQSIPAVVAFVNGQPADGFMGAVPQSQIEAFIDKVAGPAGADEAAEIAAALESAQAALAAGDIQTAGQTFAAIMNHAPDNTAAIAGMAECLLAAERKDEAVSLLEMLDEKQKADPAIARMLTRIALEEEAASLGDPTELEARIGADPADHAARIDLAKILNLRGDRGAAADQLLAVMKTDRAYGDDAARRELLTLFEAWGHGDPATLAARRKLSALLFA